MSIAEIMDRIDRRLCREGLLRSATWSDVQRLSVKRLYAGGLYRGLPQFRTHIGVTPYEFSTRNIVHDLLKPMQVPDNSIDTFQSEDVFEHLAYENLLPIIEDVFRVLKPGALFRMSLPDYRCPILRNRCIKNDAGELLFDPGGGGRLIDGKVVGGGHIWFPVYETVKALMDRSSFGKHGTVKYLHYINSNNESILETIDYSLGNVQRTPDNDPRARELNCALSIVVDARKNGI